jgi:Flp pilus assembly protein TadG
MTGYHTRSRRRGACRRGAAATEMAIFLPFLVLLFAVTLDFARLYFTTQTLDNSAFAAAMYASGTSWSKSASTQAVSAACAEGTSLSPPLTAANVSVTQGTTTTTVTITYQCQQITPVFSATRTVTLVRTFTMNLAPAAGS